MASSDTTVPFSVIDGALVITDGAAATHTVPLLRADFPFTIEGRKVTEVRVRELHMATPTVRITGDGNVTGTLTALLATAKGSADETLYEIGTYTGSPASWTTTGAGDAKLFRMTLTGTNSTGATQSWAFNYCRFSNVKVTPGGEDGLWTLSLDFVDFENVPTVT